MGHWAMAIARNIDGSGNSPDKGGQQMKAWLTPDGCFAIISPGSPGGFAFQVIVKFVFLLWSVCTWASACTAHSSVHYLRFTITISYPCVLLFAISVLLCLPLFFSARAFSLSRLSLSDFFLNQLKIYSVNGFHVGETQRAVSPISNRDSPLHPIFLRFVSFFYQCIFNANRKWNFCYLPCAFAIINSLPLCKYSKKYFCSAL
jgi:hypothetical protein